MSFEQGVQISLTVLITGLVVVFVVLIFLTLVIKGYGSILHSLQSHMDGGRTEKAPVPAAPPTAAPAAEISPEIVAAISAAVFCVLPQGTVTSVRRVPSPVRARSPWGLAGVLEGTRPF